MDNTAYSYTYDDVGNITSIQKGERAVANSSTSTDIVNASAYRSYTYDALGRLTRENNVTDNKTTVFSYDGLGNILSKQEYAYTTGSLGTANKTIEYNYSNDSKSGWNNLLTSVDLNGDGTVSSSETISYDAIGNPVTYLGKTLSWFGRQLVTFVNGSTTVTNTYDANGLRGTKTVNGETTTYQYIDGKLMYESRPGIELYYFYDSYGNLTSIRYIKAGETTAYSYYVTTNAQGDVLGIYTAAGVQVAAYEYDAWGNFTVYDVTQNSNGNNVFTKVTYSDSRKFDLEFLNPFRYRGYYYDQDMGLYYLQSRYYDSQVGRFISADSFYNLSSSGTIISNNLFAYCENNPIMYKDVAGNFIGTVMGTIIGAVLGGIQAKMEGDNVWVGIGIGAATGLISGFTVDFAVSTGGVGPILLVAAGGALANGLGYYATEKLNGREAKGGKIALNAITGALFNVFSFGFGGGSLQKISGSILQNMKNLFTDAVFERAVIKVGEKLIVKSLPNLFKNIVREAIQAIVEGSGLSIFTKMWEVLIWPQ